jgi:hypothetical protein
MRIVAALVILSLWMCADEARADDEISGGTRISYNHKGQLGLYAQFGMGYGLIARYDMSDFCGQDGKAVCTNTVPPFVELGLSIGVSRRVELITDLRLGLAGYFVPEGSTAKEPAAFVIAPGVKIYLDDKGSLKWFFTVQLAIDRTDFSASGPQDSTDFGVRNAFGLLLDLHRTFGIYFFLGDTMELVRWWSFEMDGGIGLQVRFP